ncbi:MAG TPA: response regulator [Bryobacteraceae bacterium]|nr:response regulator [Bryobacteraceae bacterium]
MAGETILIVDDVPVNLKLAGAILKREGYTIEFAEDGQQALDMLETLHPDLILSDIQMPIIDGFELARRVRQDERFRDTPMVALTALALKAGEERAREAGFDGYLTKPIDTRTMGLRVREYLDKKTTEEK